MAKRQKKPAGTKKARGLSNSQSKIVNRQPVPQVSLIWRIFHFKERFELPEDMRGFRVSGLHYTKRFVGVAGGDEAVGYQNQFAMLQNGDGLDACLLEGIYGRLVNLAAQHSRAKRGHLLDATDQPLTDSQIAKLLNINFRTMGKYLRMFESVKLLEKVALPVFDMSLNESPPKKKSNDSRGGDSEKQASGCRKDGCSGVARSSPGNPGKKRAPLKNARLKKRQTANGKRQTANGKREKEKNKVNKQRATNGLTAVNAKGKENGKAHRHYANAQGKVRSKGQVKDEPPSAPTATPPLPSEPQESDDGGLVCTLNGPPGSVKPASGQQRPAMGIVAGGYDRNDELLGKRVYVALGLRWDTESPEGRREICSFASKWAQAQARLARLPPEIIDGLGVRLIDEARKIGRRGRRNKKPGAVWCTVADKLVRARLREAM